MVQNTFFKFFYLPTVIIFIVHTVAPVSLGYAQMTPVISAPLSIPGVSLRGMTIDLKNPLQMGFIVAGDDSVGAIHESPLQDKYMRLIHYFLAALTTPEDQLWVNLSPDEPDRILPKVLDQTQIGRDLIGQDYLLKQLTASLLQPENEIGKKFWEQVYEKIYESQGHNVTESQKTTHHALRTMDLPIDLHQKVWIVPDVAKVAVRNHSVVITEARLKVMTEEEYSKVTSNGKRETSKNVTRYALPVTRYLEEIILPAIEQEINEGEQFAQLRQMYQAMILASWYKKNLKRSLLGQVYVNQQKTDGLATVDPGIKDQLYQKYLDLFRNGTNQLIREEYNPATQNIEAKTYISGGYSAVNLVVGADDASLAKLTEIAEGTQTVEFVLQNGGSSQDNSAMLSGPTEIDPSDALKVLKAWKFRPQKPEGYVEPEREVIEEDFVDIGKRLVEVIKVRPDVDKQKILKQIQDPENSLGMRAKRLIDWVMTEGNFYDAEGELKDHYVSKESILPLLNDLQEKVFTPMFFVKDGAFRTKPFVDDWQTEETSSYAPRDTDFLNKARNLDVLSLPGAVMHLMLLGGHLRKQSGGINQADFELIGVHIKTVLPYLEAALKELENIEDADLELKAWAMAAAVMGSLTFIKDQYNRLYKTPYTTEQLAQSHRQWLDDLDLDVHQKEIMRLALDRYSDLRTVTDWRKGITVKNFRNYQAGDDLMVASNTFFPDKTVQEVLLTREGIAALSRNDLQIPYDDDKEHLFLQAIDAENIRFFGSEPMEAAAVSRAMLSLKERKMSDEVDAFEVNPVWKDVSTDMTDSDMRAVVDNFWKGITESQNISPELRQKYGQLFIEYRKNLEEIYTYDGYLHNLLGFVLDIGYELPEPEFESARNMLEQIEPFILKEIHKENPDYITLLPTMNDWLLYICMDRSDHFVNRVKTLMRFWKLSAVPHLSAMGRHLRYEAKGLNEGETDFDDIEATMIMVDALVPYFEVILKRLQNPGVPEGLEQKGKIFLRSILDAFTFLWEEHDDSYLRARAQYAQTQQDWMKGVLRKYRTKYSTGRMKAVIGRALNHYKDLKSMNFNDPDGWWHFIAIGPTGYTDVNRHVSGSRVSARLLFADPRKAGDAPTEYQEKAWRFFNVYRKVVEVFTSDDAMMNTESPLQELTNLVKPLPELILSAIDWTEQKEIEVDGSFKSFINDFFDALDLREQRPIFQKHNHPFENMRTALRYLMDHAPQSRQYRENPGDFVRSAVERLRPLEQTYFPFIYHREGSFVKNLPRIEDWLLLCATEYSNPDDIFIQRSEFIDHLPLDITLMHLRLMGLHLRTKVGRVLDEADLKVLSRMIRRVAPSLKEGLQWLQTHSETDSDYQSVDQGTRLIFEAVFDALTFVLDNAVSFKERSSVKTIVAEHKDDLKNIFAKTEPGTLSWLKKALQRYPQVAEGGDFSAGNQTFHYRANNDTAYEDMNENFGHAEVMGETPLKNLLLLGGVDFYRKVFDTVSLIRPSVFRAIVKANVKFIQSADDAMMTEEWTEQELKDLDDVRKLDLNPPDISVAAANNQKKLGDFWQAMDAVYLRLKPPRQTYSSFRDYIFSRGMEKRDTIEYLRDMTSFIMGQLFMYKSVSYDENAEFLSDQFLKISGTFPFVGADAPQYFRFLPGIRYWLLWDVTRPVANTVFQNQSEWVARLDFELALIHLVLLTGHMKQGFISHFQSLLGVDENDYVALEVTFPYVIPRLQAALKWLDNNKHLKSQPEYESLFRKARRIAGIVQDAVTFVYGSENSVPDNWEESQTWHQHWLDRVFAVGSDYHQTMKLALKIFPDLTMFDAESVSAYRSRENNGFLEIQNIMRNPNLPVNIAAFYLNFDKNGYYRTHWKKLEGGLPYVQGIHEMNAEHFKKSEFSAAMLNQNAAIKISGLSILLSLIGIHANAQVERSEREAYQFEMGYQNWATLNLDAVGQAIDMLNETVYAGQIIKEEARDGTDVREYNFFKRGAFGGMDRLYSVVIRPFGFELITFDADPRQFIDAVEPFLKKTFGYYTHRTLDIAFPGAPWKMSRTGFFTSYYQVFQSMDINTTFLQYFNGGLTDTGTTIDQPYEPMQTLQEYLENLRPELKRLFGIDDLSQVRVMISIKGNPEAQEYDPRMWPVTFLHPGMYVSVVIDLAMMGQAPAHKGGIDFNADQLNLQEDGAMRFDMPPVDQAQLQSINGFIPVIISIRPTDVKALLSLP